MSADHDTTTKIIRLARAANPQEAHIWRQALEDAGICARVVGDFLDAGLGDISGVLPEVWVNREDFARARSLLDAHRSAKKAETSGEEEE